MPQTNERTRKGGPLVREERDDAGDADHRRDGGVPDLEDIRVAAEQRGADEAQGEADEDGHTDEVNLALPHELRENPRPRETAGDDEGLGVRMDADHAGQVVADGWDDRRGLGPPDWVWRPGRAHRSIRFHGPSVPPHLALSAA
jgi:hypothetical protein